MTSSTTFSDMMRARLDLSAYKEHYARLTAVIDKADAGTLPEAFVRWTDLKSGWKTAQTLAHIRYFQNTFDDRTKQEKERTDEYAVQCKAWDTDVGWRFLHHPARHILERQYGQLYLDALAAELQTFLPTIAALVQTESDLLTEHVDVLSRARSGMLPEASIAEHVDRIFDELVRTRDQIAKTLGYQDYVELGYKVTRIITVTPNDLATFRENVRKHVPSLWAHTQQFLKTMREKRSTLELNPYGDAQRIVQECARAFHQLSPELGQFLDVLIAKDLLDVEHRSGKREWGESYFLSAYKLPFIYCTFEDDVEEDTALFIHECGHGFWYHCVAHDLRSDLLPTAEADEIPSMALVYLVYPLLTGLFGGRADWLRFERYAARIEAMLSDCLVNEFEHFVYSNPDCGPDERNRVYAKLAVQYIPDEERTTDGKPDGRGWHNKAIIFSHPFYSIVYPLSEIAAQQFLARSEQDRQAALSSYITLCKASTSRPFLDLLAVANLKNPFLEETVRELAEFGLTWTEKLAL